MTVPVQRGAGGQEDAVSQVLLDSIRDVKDHVIRLEAHLGGRLDNLDQRFIPRAEYEARHSDVRNLITKGEANVSALEERLTAARRFALGTSITGFMAVVGLLSLILTNLPR